jgi:hypothetical protein
MNNLIRRLAAAVTVFGTLVLASCGGGGGSSISPPPPSGNSIVASWSVNGTVQATVNGSQAVSVSFAASDGNPVTTFTVTQDLAKLPAGWSAVNSTLSCATVTVGNSCVLQLIYAPIAPASGTLSIGYSYVDSVGKARTGTATIMYAGTTHNNVNVTVLPAGTVTVTVGGAQLVTVLLTTDDGGPATNLTVNSGLNSLPAGWTSPAPTFSCATLSSGNGCVLTLTYAPTAAASGSVQLGFTFTDNTATVQTESITIPYVSSNDNNIVATVSPAGQVATVLGGPTQTVNVTFTTDNGKPVTGLQVTAGLAPLPAGWSGPATFACGSASTGNGCQLSLAYSPIAVSSGVVLLSYKYTSGAGASRTGSLAVPYATTADDHAVATVSPSGQITAIANGGAVDVVVTFTTDDANQASSLTVTSGLASLPAGWSGPAAFACPTFAIGSGCQLTLRYAPTAAGTGALTLGFGYTSNSGAAKTGTVTVPYASTTHNNLVATVAPSGQVTAVTKTGSQDVTVTFTSDDGNPVTAVDVTSGLTTLPMDWTITPPNPLPCATVTTGPGCQLTLHFAPTVENSGTIALGYAYADNAGAAQSGTVDIPYFSVPTYFFASEQTDTVLRCAARFADGSLSACGKVASGFATPYGISFSGNFAYIADRGDELNHVFGALQLCAVNPDDTFGACVPAAPAPMGAPPVFHYPTAVAFSGSYAYVADADGAKGIQVCTVNPDGTLSGCAPTATSVNGTSPNVPDGIVIANGYGYIVDYNGSHLTSCLVNADGTLGSVANPCAQQVIGPQAEGLTVNGAYLYVGTGDPTSTTNITVCHVPAGPNPINVATDCVPTGPTSPATQFSRAVGFAFLNNYVYVSGYGGASGTIGGIVYCPLNADGTFSSCTRSTDPVTKAINLFGMAAH